MTVVVPDEPGLDLITDQKVFHRFFHSPHPPPLSYHPFTTLFNNHVPQFTSDLGSRRISVRDCCRFQDQRHLQMRKSRMDTIFTIRLQLLTSIDRSTASDRRLLAIDRNLGQAQQHDRRASHPRQTPSLRLLPQRAKLRRQSLRASHRLLDLVSLARQRPGQHQRTGPRRLLPDLPQRHQHLRRRVSRQQGLQVKRHPHVRRQRNQRE
jgi:hypothetical protein